MSIRDFDKLFQPQAIAVIADSAGLDPATRLLMRNLLQGEFPGPVMPVSPQRAIQGVLCYPTLADLPQTPDLAILCTTRQPLPETLTQLARCGVKMVIAHRTPTTDATAIHHAALQQGIRLLGPHSLGIIAPHHHLNASFLNTNALPGKVALVHQSEALCAAVLDWAYEQSLGFSHFISLGDSADINIANCLDYLATSVAARAILLHLHTIPNARHFMSAARQAARRKPVIVVKTGRVQESTRLLDKSLAVDDPVFDAALRRAGLLRVFSSQELFDAVATLSHALPMPGERLVIISNGIGPAMLATDDLILGGGVLAELSPATQAALTELLPANTFCSNPIDVQDPADATRYREVLAMVLKDRQVDAVLVLHAPQGYAASETIAEAVIQVAQTTCKPVLTSWLGGPAVATARQRFIAAGLPTYDTPDKAVRAFLHLIRYQRNQALLMETPPSIPTDFVPDSAAAKALITEAFQNNPTSVYPYRLPDRTAQALLAAYGIAAVNTRIAQDAASAAACAEAIGFPVAVKVISADLADRSQVGGVVLYQNNAEQVYQSVIAMQERVNTLRPDARIEGFAIQPMLYRPHAHEVRLMAWRDAVFGPVLSVGQGGPLGRIHTDQAVALPPLNLHLAQEAIGRTRIGQRLMAAPPAEVDHPALVLAFVRLSQFVIELPAIETVTLSPLLVDRHGVLALDIAITIRPTTDAGGDALAIRPYPKELEESYRLRSGQTVLIRPIRPEDEGTYYAFQRQLTKEDLFFRFFSHTRWDIPHIEMARLTQIDYDREMGFVAITTQPSGEDELLGVVHTSTDPDNRSAEFAIVVRSDLQGQGLGKKLLSKMIDYCRTRGTQEIVGQVLKGNRSMLWLTEALGFQRHYDEEDEIVEVRRPLQD